VVKFLIKKSVTVHVPVPLVLPVLAQGSGSQETFRQQFHHLSGKPEEVVLFRSRNDIACWSRTYMDAQLHSAEIVAATRQM